MLQQVPVITLSSKTARATGILSITAVLWAGLIRPVRITKEGVKRTKF